MNIVVIAKQVPDLVEELVIAASGTAIDADEVDSKLNEFDDHALEEALLLKEAQGGDSSVTVVTVVALDGEGVDKVLFTALAKGADRVVKLTGPEPEEFSGNFALATAFAQVLRDWSYDLILTGVQACDDRDGSLAPALGTLLGHPNVSVVTNVERVASGVQLTKEYSGGIAARFEVDLPAVLGVQAAKATPRYAPVSKVRQIQSSATIEQIEIDDPVAGLSQVTAMAPPKSGAGAQMLGSVEALLAVLKDKGVVS